MNLLAIFTENETKSNVVTQIDQLQLDNFFINCNNKAGQFVISGDWIALAKLLGTPGPTSTGDKLICHACTTSADEMKIWWKKYDPAVLFKKLSELY